MNAFYPDERTSPGIAVSQGGCVFLRMSRPAGKKKNRKSENSCHSMLSGVILSEKEVTI